MKPFLRVRLTVCSGDKMTFDVTLPFQENIDRLRNRAIELDPELAEILLRHLPILLDSSLSADARQTVMAFNNQVLQDLDANPGEAS